MTDTSQQKPADKVWAKYDGPYAAQMDIPLGKWYEAVRLYRYQDTGQLRIKINWPDASFVEGYRQIDYLAENWHFHVGPTPPRTGKDKWLGVENNLDSILAALPDMQGEPDWHPHHGTAKRPKGVGKRDRVEVENHGPFGVGRGERLACDAAWSIVTRYRIIERAPKKEKREVLWFVKWRNQIITFATELEARNYNFEQCGTLLTAKLTPVKDTDK